MVRLRFPDDTSTRIGGRALSRTKAASQHKSTAATFEVTAFATTAGLGTSLHAAAGRPGRDSGVLETSFLGEEPKSVATVERYLSTIVQARTLANLPDPTKTSQVKAAYWPPLR